MNMWEGLFAGVVVLGVAHELGEHERRERKSTKSKTAKSKSTKRKVTKKSNKSAWAF